MSHAAQCLLCKHARHLGRTVVGCSAFEEIDPPIVAAALTGLIYRAAATAPCPVRDAYEFHADAYFAEDLPPDQEK